MTKKIETTKQQLIESPRNKYFFSNEFKEKCNELKSAGTVQNGQYIKYLLNNGGLPFKGVLYNEQNTEKKTYDWLFEKASEIEADASAQEAAVEAERAAAEKAVESEKGLITFTKSHFRRITGSLMQEDFEGRYFNNNTPLHIIFSLNEELQSLSAIKKLQELFNGEKINSAELRNIFEAENADSITPIEVLLANPAQTMGAIFLAIKNLEFLNILLNAGTKNGTICEIAGKRLYVENQVVLERVATQTTAHTLIINKCLNKFVENFMAKIMSELNLALYKHTKVDIKTKTSELYKLVQNNDVLKAKFLSLLNIESINNVITEVYSRDIIKDKLKFIEQTERLSIDGLLENDINMANIELHFNRIANLNITFYRSGLLDNNFGYTVVRAIKAKLNIVLNKAVEAIKIANEEQLKNVYEAALKTIKPYEPIYIKKGFDDLEQHLKNAGNNRISDFLQDVCKPQEKYLNQQEAEECLDKLYALKQHYSFLRNSLCFMHKAAANRYIEGSMQDMNSNKNLFSDLTCKEKANAISVPLAIVGAAALYMSGAGIAGAAIASGMFLLGLNVNKEMDATHSIFTSSSIGAAIVGLSYLEHGVFYASKAAALGSIMGGTLTGIGEVVGTVIDKALDCE
jgi:hypothetical protein